MVHGVLSGILALFAFGRAVALLGAGPAALFPALTPAVAVLIAVPLVGEVPSWSQGAGLLLATAGLLTALGRRAPTGPAGAGQPAVGRGAISPSADHPPVGS